MKSFLEEDYSGLTKIVDETIAEAKASGNEKVLDMVKFRDKMEPEFARLGFRNIPKGGVDNVLIVDIGMGGDFLLTTAAIREIRMNYPYANITLLVCPPSYSVAECCPYINEVLCFDDYLASEKNILTQLKCSMDYATKYLLEKHFVVAFNIRYVSVWHTTSTLLTYLSGARTRVGSISYALAYFFESKRALPFEKNYGNILLTHPVTGHKEITHTCMRNLSILTDYGLKIHNTDLELWYNASDSIKAEKLLSGFAPNRIKIAVGINASERFRKYPAKKYLPALKEIIDKGASIIIFGGPAEKDDAKFLQKNLPEEFVMNLTEILPGRRVEAAILSEHADMYLGNMTGSADMAAAARLPSIVLTNDPLKKSSFSFYPWQTNAIFIDPKVPSEQFEGKTIDELAPMLRSTVPPFFIDKIEPEEIVAAYDEMIHFLKYSGIRKTKCPSIIRNIDVTKKISGLFKRV